jgi:hypothetical protein
MLFLLLRIYLQGYLIANSKATEHKGGHQMHYLKSLLVVLFILFSVNVSMAEPTANIKYLLSDSVSMMDFGLYKIENKLEKELDNPDRYGLNRETIVSVVSIYDWDKNRIIISVHVRKATSQEQAKRWCKTIVTLVKTNLNVNPDTGEAFSLFKNSGALYFWFFNHAGYTKKSEPKELYKELDNITVIDVEFEIEGMKDLFKCETPLLSNKIMYQE